MNAKITGSAVAMLMLAGFAGAAEAGMPPTYSSNGDTAGFIGMQLELGDMVPSVVGGVRYTKTDESHDVTGVKGQLSLPLSGDSAYLPTAKVLGLAGSRNVQGEAGIGYNFGTNSPLLSGGVQGPYANGGIDLYLDGNPSPFIGANSLGKAADRGENIPPP